MLALSIAINALSDPTASGQPAAAPGAADDFVALLNVGAPGGNDLWSSSLEQANNTANADSQSVAGNPVTQSVNVPTSIFAAHTSGSHQNNQEHNAPAPSQPQSSEQSPHQPPSSSNNTTNNSGDQNAPAASSATSGNSNPQTNNTTQNADSADAGQPSAPVVQVQAGGNVTPAKKLSTQLQDQLGNISQILANMIQALSAPAATQTVTPTVTATAGTSDNGTTGAVGSDGQPGTGSQNDQEISLLKDMQSLLQQLQQSLSGQGGGGNDVQKLSDSLLSDMAKLSQLANQQANANNTADNSSTNGTQLFGDLTDLLKSSIAQAKGQLQTLQAANDAVYAQAQSQTTQQTQPLDSAATPKITFDAKDASANANTVTTASTPSAPVVQDVTLKPVAENLQFVAPPVQTNVSQDGGSSANNSGQDSGQNQTGQPVVAATASSPNSVNATGNASFAKILSQVSPGDVLNQVYVNLKTLASDGSSKISIQLNPPDLGKVDVRLTVDASGKTSGITITASNNDTLNLLKNDTQGLTRALNDAGLTTDSGSLNFNLGGQQNQTQGGSQQAALTYQQAQPEEDDSAINTVSRSYVINMADGLNITV